MAYILQTAYMMGAKGSCECESSEIYQIGMVDANSSLKMDIKIHPVYTNVHTDICKLFTDPDLLAATLLLSSLFFSPPIFYHYEMISIYYIYLLLYSYCVLTDGPQE